MPSFVKTRAALAAFDALDADVERRIDAATSYAQHSAIFIRLMKAASDVAAALAEDAVTLDARATALRTRVKHIEEKMTA